MLRTICSWWPRICRIRWRHVSFRSTRRLRNSKGAYRSSGGLRLGAVLTASSEEAATQLADTLKGMVASLPPVAQGIQVDIDQINSQNVTLAMAITEEQLQAGLKTAAPVVAKAEPQPEPVAPKPAGPQIIRIYGLDGGTREIVMR